ncbi:hypothetical protein LINPERHAP2_LOCUS28658 [Linum perenne]
MLFLLVDNKNPHHRSSSD